MFCRQEVVATIDVEPEVRPTGRMARRALPYFLFAAGLVGGIALGVEHLREGGRILFVFRGDEPLPAWIAVGSLLGTLPAVLLALINPRVAAGALWLLATSLLLVWALFILLPESDRPSLLDGLKWLAVRPLAQALVGAVFWFSRRPGQSE